MIEVQELQKRFGRVRAVESISFACRDGAITTLLGGNGSGKTTTLRLIAGVLKPDAGRVLIDGAIDVSRERTRALTRLGVLHDEFELYPRLTVREHIQFAAELNGLGGRELRQSVNEAIGLLGLGDIENRRAAGMSHGQRMKIALARAVVHRPPNLILDEPTRGLDIFGVRTLRATLKRLRDAGTCILMSNHVMAEVAELSDDVVVLGGGNVLAHGSMQEIQRATGAGDLESAFVTLAGGSTVQGTAA